jgi:subtilase family serine protease
VKLSLGHSRSRSSSRSRRRLIAACGVGSATLALAAGLATGCGTQVSGAASHPAPTVNTATRVAPAGYTALTGSVHPYASIGRDLGRLDPTTPLEGASMLLAMTPAQKLRAKLVQRDLEDPTSPSYHKWITPEQFGAWFGASDADLARATAWLKGQGLAVHGAPTTRSRLFFSGTVDQVERAFQMEIHRYDVGGKEHFAPAMAPLVPDHLASLVMGIHGLHDFHLTPTGVRPHDAAKPGAIFPIPEDGGTEGFLSLAPSDFATIYGVAPLYDRNITGKGQTIAIVGETDFVTDDIVQFRSAYGFDTSNLPKRTLVPLSGSSYLSIDATSEAELDLEWSGAIAKDAKIDFIYVGNNPSYGIWDSIIYAIEHRSAPVVSASYAGCEYGMAPTDMIWAEVMGDAAAMEGMTLMTAAGDWGATGCDFGPVQSAAYYGLQVNWPTSIPSVVSVGGTELNWGGPFPQPLITTATMTQDPLAEYWACTGSGDNVTGCTPKGYVPETGWNELAFEEEVADYWWGAGGGGQSVVFPRPIWQQGIEQPGQNRMVPDIALSAAYAQVGYMMYESWSAADGDSSAPFPGEMAPTGGTSAATPSFAGILTLVNQVLSNAHPELPVGVGNANPVLYALEQTTRASSRPIFHDITTGNNMMPCAPGSLDCPETDGGVAQIGYTAGPGYDMVTGLGSIDAERLARAWTELAPTSTSLRVRPLGSTEGSSVQLSASVVSTGSSELSGSVLFYAETLDAQGHADLSQMATAPVTAFGHEAIATATVVIPPGLSGNARVVAFYSGDAHDLASWSSDQAVTARSDFAVAPAALTVQANASFTLSNSGGVAPAQWVILRDSTCNAEYYCSYEDSQTATTATFIAGPDAGQTTIAAIDADGAEARVVITVTASSDDPGAE